MERNILELILDGSMEPTSLPLHLLQQITKQFSPKQKIGSGGFGDVYKGLLQNGTVAVKKVFTTPTTQDDQFNREANNLMMMRVKHQNVVRFLGYCSVTETRFEKIRGELVRFQIWERLLCFEYMSNGSLMKHITGELSGLEWHTRYLIIRGICEGLRYLHEEKHMIHRDLKPENILLDDHMVPKIADFGLSKLLDGVSRAVTSNRSFSMWYCDPEFKEHGEVSSKLDIYSLGVIIIEVVTGRKECPDVNKVLRRWRYRWSKSANKTPLPLGYQQVARCMEIGLLCKEKDTKKRPTISKIIDYLNQVDNSDDNTYKSTIGQWSQNSLVTDNPQLKRCIAISQRCVDADQHKRPTADEINEIETMNQLVPRPAFGHSSNNNSGPWQEQVNSGSMQLQPDRKTSWPECVGMPATAAYDQIYKDCWPDVAVELLPLGSHILPGINPKRVRIFIDERGAVLETPVIG